MAVMQGTRVDLVSFIECLAYIVEAIDAYDLMPSLTYGNIFVYPGNLIVRAEVNLTSNTLIVYCLDGEELWYDLGQCLTYVDADGESIHTLKDKTVIIQTLDRDSFEIKLNA